MADYKQEIVSTRKGCVGSSDGRMLMNIATLGYVPKSAYKRLAVVKGVEEPDDIQTPQMRFGDLMEQAIFANLSNGSSGYESNPLWRSVRYSKEHVSLISHPDIVHENREEKTLDVFEVKTTRFSVDETMETYMPQLYVHKLLAEEKVSENGAGWRVRLWLVVYDSTDVDMDYYEEHEFDPERLSIREVKISAPLFDIDKAMDIVEQFLCDDVDMSLGEEIDADLLPVSVREKFDAVTNALREIKEREDMVAKFKETLYDFLCEKDVKSIKNDYFTISRIDPSESVQLNARGFVSDIRKDHPDIYKEYVDKNSELKQKKGYVLIKVR